SSDLGRGSEPICGLDWRAVSQLYRADPSIWLEPEYAAKCGRNGIIARGGANDQSYCQQDRVFTFRGRDCTPGVGGIGQTVRNGEGSFTSVRAAYPGIARGITDDGRRIGAAS